MQTTTTETTHSGAELRLRRERLGAELQAVALAMGVSRYTVWRIEKSGEVKTLAAIAYLKALRAIEAAA